MARIGIRRRRYQDNINRLDTGEPLYRRVNEKFEFEPKPIFEVAVRAADGREETYRATGNHPFWIENHGDETGWTAAEDLRAGDALRLADGTAASVISLTETGTNEPVYNMDVDGWHTYHVGILGTWVHNMNCGKVDAAGILSAVVPKPVSKVVSHAHHILFENGHGVAQKALVRVGSRILAKHGIDHKTDIANLVWAPLYGKGIGPENLVRMVTDLIANRHS